MGNDHKCSNYKWDFIKILKKYLSFFYLHYSTLLFYYFYYSFTFVAVHYEANFYLFYKVYKILYHFTCNTGSMLLFDSPLLNYHSTGSVEDYPLVFLSIRRFHSNNQWYHSTLAKMMLSNEELNYTSETHSLRILLLVRVNSLNDK